MGISVSTSKQSVTATVNDQTVNASVAGGNTSSATVTAGFGATGAQGPSGVVNVTAPITYNAATQTVSLNYGDGLTVAQDNATSLLLHFDGADGSTSFTDSSQNSHPVTRGGNATISTAQSKFGGSSVLLAGGGDCVTVPAGSAFAYGTGDFTIEAWIYRTNTAQFGIVFAQTVSGANYVLFGVDGDGTVRFYATLSGGGDPGIAGPAGTLVTENTWHHIAVVRSSGYVTVYCDGVGGEAVQNTTNFTDTTRVPTVGRYTHASDLAFVGHIDELRVVKGQAVYNTANFTPPTAPLTAINGANQLVTEFGSSAGTVCEGSDPRLSNSRNPTSHSHGNITNAGAIGTTSGLVITTGESGVLGALTLGSAGHVLTVNSKADGVEWAAANGGGSVSIDATAADVLSATSGTISADDPGADRIVFWDDSASKLTHLEVSTGLAISGTTISLASHSHSASDLTSGTLSASLLPTSGVAAGTYTSVTVDTYGRVTAGSSPAIAYSSLTGLPTLGTAAAASTTDFAAASHNQAWSTITSTPTTLAGYGITDAVASNDSRLTDSRTPTSHASSHQIGGSDAVTNVVNSPSQISSNQNDYTLPSADVVRLTSDAARTITGFVAGTAGRVVVLVNVGSFAITLSHQSTSSTAANRVIVPWSADYILDPAYAAVLVYDGTTSRWRIV